jgi:hypothetical protein
VGVNTNLNTVVVQQPAPVELVVQKPATPIDVNINTNVNTNANTNINSGVLVQQPTQALQTIPYKAKPAADSYSSFYTTSSSTASGFTATRSNGRKLMADPVAPGGQQMPAAAAAPSHQAGNMPQQHTAPQQGQSQQQPQAQGEHNHQGDKPQGQQHTDSSDKHTQADHHDKQPYEHHNHQGERREQQHPQQQQHYDHHSQHPAGHKHPSEEHHHHHDGDRMMQHKGHRSHREGDRASHNARGDGDDKQHSGDYNGRSLMSADQHYHGGYGGETSEWECGAMHDCTISYISYIIANRCAAHSESACSWGCLGTRQKIGQRV